MRLSGAMESVSCVVALTLELMALGSHENFHRDIKRRT